MVLNKRAADFKATCVKVLGSDGGRKLLQYLKEQYIDVSVITERPEHTYANIGKADLVTLLIKMAGIENEISNQTVKQEVDNDATRVTSSSPSAYDL